MTYHQASIKARMFDELVSHLGTFCIFLELAESLIIPVGLERQFIFPIFLLLFDRTLGPPLLLLLLLHIIIPLFLDFRFKIFDVLIHEFLYFLLQEDL